MQGVVIAMTAAIASVGSVATTASVAGRTGAIAAVGLLAKRLIVGGIAGGGLGNIIAPGDSRPLGTIPGAAGGAVEPRAIDRNGARCR